MVQVFCSLLLSCLTVACQSSSKGNDVYDSFDHLVRTEPASSYQIDFKKRKADVLVLAPHGGYIEHGTSEIARALAGRNWSYYSFKGMLKKGNRRLHITSDNFDEPNALEMTSKAEVCLSIHGYASQPNSPNICFGGRNDELAQRLHLELNRLEIQNTDEFNACGRFYGQSENNIANRCNLEGVQMELSSQFRDKLLKNKALRNKFNQAVRRITGDFLQESQQ